MDVRVCQWKGRRVPECELFSEDWLPHLQCYFSEIYISLSLSHTHTRMHEHTHTDKFCTDFECVVFVKSTRWQHGSEQWSESHLLGSIKWTTNNFHFNLHHVLKKSEIVNWVFCCVWILICMHFLKLQCGVCTFEPGTEVVLKPEDSFLTLGAVFWCKYPPCTSFSATLNLLSSLRDALESPRKCM